MISILSSSIKVSSVSFCNILILLSLSLLVKMEEKKHVDRTLELLNNLRLTHWNDWDANASCANGLYATGLRLRTGLQQIDSKDETEVTTVTGFELTCSDGLYPRNKTVNKATFGKNGEWTDSYECKKGFAIGISTKLSPHNSPSTSRILNMTLHCSDSEESSKLRSTDEEKHLLVHPENDNEFMQFCEIGDSLTGLSIRADSVITITKGDIASVKGIGTECRRVSNPVNSCEITFGWEKRKISKCIDKQSTVTTKEGKSETESISKKTCKFDTWIGIGTNDRINNAAHIIETYQSIGTNNDPNYVKWLMLKKLLLPDVKDWFIKQFPQKPNALDDFLSDKMWKKMFNSSEEVEFEFSEKPTPPMHMFDKLDKGIQLKYAPTVQQLVGYCGVYKVGFDLFNIQNYLYFEQSIKNRMTRILFEK